MKLLPKARTESIVEQDVDKELLIYDLLTDKAYTLNETSKAVYKACDGETSFDELNQKHKFTDDLINFALDELKKNNLIEYYQSDHFAGLSRREVIRRIGLTSMIVLPVISSLVAPSAVSAASTCVNVGGIAPNAVVRIGNFAGCFADCSDATVGARCCSNSARPGVVCDPGPPQRTACNCN